MSRFQIKELTDIINKVHDDDDYYWVNMYWANRVTGRVNLGRPSVASTIGTVLLNYACSGKYATMTVLLEAMRQSGDLSLERNRHSAIKSLTKDTDYRDADFIIRRVNGHGNLQFIFPSDSLIKRMYRNVCNLLTREKAHQNACKRLINNRKERTKDKIKELRTVKKEVEKIAQGLGYSLPAPTAKKAA